MRQPAAAVVLALVLGVQPLAGCAQPADGPAAAQQALRAGDYLAARAAFEAHLGSPADSNRAEVVAGYADTFLATGTYEAGLQAAEALLAEAPADAHVLLMHGHLLAATGRYDEAEAAFRLAGRLAPDHGPTVLALADLLVATGRRREAMRFYAALYDAYKRGRFQTAAGLGLAGRAAAALEDFHDANSAFRTAYQLDPADVTVLYGWAELFRAKYNEADAQRTYQEALAQNPHHADVYVGLAKTVGGFGQKEELARQALAANPRHVGALSLLAGLRILDGDYDAAEAMVGEALAVNPASLEALAHRAAIHHLRGDAEAFAGAEQQALAINPEAGAFYLTIAEDLGLRFRYPAAVEISRKAVAVDPDNPATQAALGTSLLRLGFTDEARRYLDRSFRQDPFNLFVGNTLTLLDEYQDFDLLESEHFVLLIHQSERPVLGAAILDEAEACYAALHARYPYTPAGKIRLEAYHDRDDFAVRIAGVPHLGLLGVSFGDVVAINTPQAQAGRPYNWARTLWHELAHTMAIGVSDFHVPRWFTEGLSVYEEQRARPAWGREMDLELFTAFDQDKLLPLAEIDRGFTRPSFPGQILLSYYHASKVVGFIVAQHGFEAIPALLTALRDGLPMEAAFQQALGRSQADLDAAFRADLRQHRDAFDQVLAGLPDLLGDEGEDTPSLLDKLNGQSDNLLLQRLQQGRDALGREDYAAAEARFQEALALYPAYTGPGNAYTGLAAVYQARGQRGPHRAILERFLDVSEYGVEEARTVADLYEEDGDVDAAVRFLERTLDVAPYDLPTHDRLAMLYTQQGRHGRAVRARQAILALNPVDRAKAYYDLARSLYLNNNRPQAKRAVLQSLELAPGYRAAQQLLLDCVEES